MACFPGLGVAPLQSESRYKSRRWRGVKKGEEARGTKQPRKEKVRCQRERGVKAAEKTDKCSKSRLTLHDVFFPPTLVTLFVPPALSLHIPLPSSHLCLSCTCVTPIPPFLSVSILFACFISSTHTHSSSFPTLKHLYLYALICPYPPFLLEAHWTPFRFISEPNPNPSVHS